MVIHSTRSINIVGWIGVGFNLLLSGVWAVWGSIENFHEGWYSVSLLENLSMLIFQYLLLTIVFILLGMISVRFKRVGLTLHLVVIAGSAWFFRQAAFSILGLMILLPMAVHMLLLYFGSPRPRRWALLLLWVVPLAIVLILSVPRLIQTSARVDDGDYGLKTVDGNGVTLTWAPRGPGWPDRGVSWEEAARICRHLSWDGASLCKAEQNYWRLPTVAEAVASMTLHNQNAGGVWHAQTGSAEYALTPDKETPLWDPHSKVIYYWTADTTACDHKAFIIVYHGGVYTRNQADSQAYLSFRAVREPDRKE